jgi:hypothetical protein
VRYDAYCDMRHAGCDPAAKAPNRERGSMSRFLVGFAAAILSSIVALARLP